MREISIQHQVYAPMCANASRKQKDDSAHIAHWTHTPTPTHSHIRMQIQAEAHPFHDAATRILIVIVARCVCLNCFWGFVRCNENSNLVENVAPLRPTLSKPELKSPTEPEPELELESGTFRLHWHKDFRTWQAAAIIYRRCVSRLRG